MTDKLLIRKNSWKTIIIVNQAAILVAAMKMSLIQIDLFIQMY